jgi:hypothetical protein
MSLSPIAVTPTRLTVAELARLHGDHSAAMLLLLVAFLSLTPLIGVSLLILLIAARWHRPGEAISIPSRLGRLQLSARWSERCERSLRAAYRWAQARLTSRWTVLLAPATHRGWGLWIGLMGALSLLPLPLVNVLPAISLMLLSLAWICRDGVALAASVLVGVAAIVCVGLMGHLLVAIAQGAMHWLRAAA